MGGFPAARLTDLTAHGGTVILGCPTVLMDFLPASRIGDMHVCPMVTVLVPHVGGPFVLGSFTVIVGGMPQSRVTDMLVCVGPPDMLANGSPTVMVGMAGGGGGGGSVMGAIVAGLKALVSPPTPPAEMQPDGTIKTPAVTFPGIVITGPPAFQAKVLADLGKISQTPTGKKLLDSIAKSGKTVTIQPQDPGAGNATGYANGADRFYKANGDPGKGTDATVYYDPDTKKIGDEPWETRPPAIGLAHELVHADQANHGTMSDGTTDNDKKADPADPSKTAQEKTREVEAAGIPPNDNRDFNENKIRSEWDPKQPQRQWY